MANRLMEIKRGRDELPPRILLYGTEGIGKTTFGASSPSPILVQTEDGAGQIVVDKFPVRTEFLDVLEDLDSLVREQHEYQTVVIDSLDCLEKLIWDYVCQIEGVKSIEKACGGYGKGYHECLRFWRQFTVILDQLRERGMATILVAHSKIEKFEDPENPAYDRYSPRLHKIAANFICEWCDAVLFATRRIRTIKTESKGGERVIAKTNGTDERIIRTVGGPACVAKNRYGIQGDLPLSWDAFFQFISGGTANVI